MFLMGMSNYFSPLTARAFATGGIVELRRVLWKGALLFGATIGSFCLLFLLSGDRLLVFVYGGKYAGYGLVIGCAAGCVLAYAYDTLATNALWAMERPQANFAGNLAALVVTLAAAFLLIRPLGPAGAALCTFSGAVAGATVRGVTVFRLFARANR
jgi:O-antigen/teichoic acid export membrane protein